MMRIRFHTILGMLVLTVLAVSCARKEEFHEDPPEPSYTGTDVIKFIPTLEDGDWVPLKAAYDPVDDAALRAGGFGVYAFYTGRESYSSQTDSSAYANFGLIFKNRRFYYDSGWTHAGTEEYWPATDGDKVTFQAYAPYSTWSSEVSYDGKVASIQYDDYVAQALTVSELNKQRDILWGTTTGGLTHTDVSAKDYATEGTVDMHFRHAVAKLDFNIMGILSGEDFRETGYGEPAYEYADTTGPFPATAPANPASTTVTTNERSVGTRYHSGVYYCKDYTCIQTQTKTETYTDTLYRITTTTIPTTYTTNGNRYLIESVSFKGFNQTGTLLLHNGTAYSPTWTDVTPFGGNDPEYILSPDVVGTALKQSLHYVTPATVRDNYTVYTGISQTPIDLMDGRYLYAIPKEVNAPGDRIQVGLTYHVLYVNGTLARPVTHDSQEYTTRVLTRTRTRSRTGRYTEKHLISGIIFSDIWPEPDEVDPNTFTYNVSWASDEDGWGDWTQWNAGDWNVVWTEVDGSAGPESTGELVMTGTPEVYYIGEPRELSSHLVTSLQGGRAYTISILLAGDKLELKVAPRPWELEDRTYVYTSEINDIIQALTYDSSTIDYADASGNVYINNRMGKFYFRLDSGKYVAWQASLVGDAAFGFTDENGNFLLDESGNRVSSIRYDIDPEVMNFIYVKAVDNTSPVTSKAKLRIYYLDASNNVTVAHNLVNMQGVNEWTIVQNAN